MGKKKKSSSSSYGHVMVICVVIIFIYYSTVFVFIKNWFSFTSSAGGVFHSLFFSFLSFLSVVSYLLAMRSDPGRVPPHYQPDIEEEAYPIIHEIKRKGGDLRYCKKCSLYKPPRSHHCRICKRCVLRMDHHCVWMNNCVGHANYKVFFVFVVYALLSCLYSLILLVGSLTVDTQQQREEGSDRTVYIISGLLLIPLTMALGVFLGWHIYLTVQNKTTIEHYEGVRAMLLAEQGGNVYSHPYDLGVYENLITVLGPNILCWVCPVSSYIGSGLRFRTAYDDAAGLTTSSTSATSS